MSADVAQIQTVVHEALVAEHQLGVVPGPVTGSSISPDVRAQMLAHSRDVLSAHYAGPLLTTRIVQFQATIKAEGNGGAIILGGGAKDFALEKISVAGTTASVTVRATTYLTVASGTSAPAANPENISDYTLQLEKTGERWLITAESFAFVPGHGP